MLRRTVGRRGGRPPRPGQGAGQELEAEEPAKARLVKLRYFAGLSVELAAEAMGISEATAKRHWVYARAWLYGKVRAGDRTASEASFSRR